MRFIIILLLCAIVAPVAASASPLNDTLQDMRVQDAEALLAQRERMLAQTLAHDRALAAYWAQYVRGITPSAAHAGSRPK